MPIKLEPAIFIFNPVATKLVRMLWYSHKTRLSHDEARSLVASALGFSKWDEVSALGINETNTLMENLIDNNFLKKLKASVERTTKTVLANDEFGRIAAFLSGRIQSKSTGSTFDVYEDGVFRGIVFSTNDVDEVFHSELTSENTSGSRWISTTEGIKGLDRAMIVGGFQERRLTPEANDELADAWRGVPFFRHSNLRHWNCYSEQYQHLHFGSTSNQLVIVGCGAAAVCVESLVEWVREGKVRKEICRVGEVERLDGSISALVTDGVFIGHSDVFKGQDEASMEIKFLSGNVRDRYFVEDGKVKLQRDKAENRYAE